MSTYLQTYNATATWATQTISVLQEIANKVRFTSTGYVDGLAWRRVVNGTGNKPQHLRLWDGPTQTILVDVPAVTDDGLIGWQWSYLAQPVAVQSGRDYYVSTGWVSGDTRGQELTHPLTSVPAEYVIPASYCYFVNNNWGFPVTDNANGAVFPMDVEWSAGGSPVNPQPATSGDVDNALADWLISTSDNTHQTDGLPWLTKAQVDDTNTKVTSGLNLAGGLQGLSDSLAHTLQMASDWLASGSTTIFTDLKNRVLGASGGGGSAFYGPGGTQVATGVEQLLASCVDPTVLGAHLALLREQLTLSPDLADTTRWTLVDTVTGAGDGLVDLQADLYTLTLTAIPAPQPQLSVADSTWVPRWGWVCPRVHGRFHQRQFQDVLPAVVTARELFMDGLLIHTEPAISWSVSAYTLDR